MAAGDGEHPIREIFPGIAAPDGTGASGSAPNRSSSDAVDLAGSSGLPGVGTVAPLAGQADPGSDTTTTRGQNDLGVLGADRDPGYTSTGASGSPGLTDHWNRLNYQQEPGNA